MTKTVPQNCRANLPSSIFMLQFSLSILSTKNQWQVPTNTFLNSLIILFLLIYQTYVTDIFLAQSWRDSRLRLPENMSEDYRILDVDWLHSIWRPDCFFKNAKSVTFHEMTIPNHYLWLYHDKTLLYMSKYVEFHLSS